MIDAEIVAMFILLQYVVQQRGNGVNIVPETTIPRECEDKRKVRSQNIRRVCMELMSSVTQSPMKGLHVLNENQIETHKYELKSVLCNFLLKTAVFVNVLDRSA